MSGSELLISFIGNVVASDMAAVLLPLPPPHLGGSLNAQVYFTQEPRSQNQAKGVGYPKQ